MKKISIQCRQNEVSAKHTNKTCHTVKTQILELVTEQLIDV